MEDKTQTHISSLAEHLKGLRLLLALCNALLAMPSFQPLVFLPMYHIITVMIWLNFAILGGNSKGNHQVLTQRFCSFSLCWTHTFKAKWPTGRSIFALATLRLGGAHYVLLAGPQGWDWSVLSISYELSVPLDHSSVVPVAQNSSKTLPLPKCYHFQSFCCISLILFH